MKSSSQLRRNLGNRRVAGVAAGLSDFFGLDVTLIRVAFILLTIFTGSGILVYLLCWLLMPAGTGTPGRTRRGPLWFVLVIAVVIGMANVAYDHRVLLVAVVVVAVALFLWRKLRGRTSWRARKEFDKARLAWQRRLDEQASPPTTMGNTSFQIDSFYPAPPPDDNQSGFQTQ